VSPIVAVSSAASTGSATLYGIHIVDMTAGKVIQPAAPDTAMHSEHPDRPKFEPPSSA
jgi:hypothetical protein